MSSTNTQIIGKYRLRALLGCLALLISVVALNSPAFAQPSTADETETNAAQTADTQSKSGETATANSTETQTPDAATETSSNGDVGDEEGEGDEQDATSELIRRVLTVIREREKSSMNSGDTAWILTATALVLFMTIPALALFYGGLVRGKNILSILMQCLSITAVVSVIWVLFGYSLVFDTNLNQLGIHLHSFIGGYEYVMLNGMRDINHDTIPAILFALFQLTFAVITPALIIGSFAERIKFSAVMMFTPLWIIIVYIPIAHMTWGGGLFQQWGVIDFAGGIVVHITAGFAALVACIMVGPRKGYPVHLDPPHSTTLTLVGTGMLWVGWFGFNGGSALKADGDAAMAILVTHLSASVATLTWMGVEYFKFRKCSVLGAATGSIAGLAAITPASGSVGPLGAMVIGLTAGLICFLFATTVKHRFGYDDSLDVFGVHGIGGLIGTILVGVFGATVFGGSEEGMNILRQLGNQSGAAAITAVYTVIATFIVLKLTSMVVGLRVDQSVENEGLDLGEHGERGYNI
jgi:Amt family ammonium transporter